MNYNAATPGEAWESISPHLKGNGSGYIPKGGTWQNPDGMCVACSDGSASFVEFGSMTYMVNPYGDWIYIPNPPYP
jgi:hypothetical protein